MKKKNVLRLLSLLSVLALCIGLMAGCGSTGSGAESAASSAQAASGNEAVQETEQAADPAPDSEATTEADPSEASAAEPEEYVSIFPLEETEEFTMYYVWSPRFVELGYDSPNDFTYFAELERRTNVHIDFTTIGANIFQEDFLLRMATQDYTDIFFNCAGSYNGGISKALEDEAWIDLAPYMEEYAPNYMALMDSDPEFSRANYTDEGAIGEFMQYYINSFNNGGDLIRKDWLDAVGKDIPVTYDDWFDVLSAFTSEYDLTDSIVQTVPTSGFWVSNTDGYVVRDGKVINAYAEADLAKPYLEICNKWYDAGLLTMDAIAANYTDSDMWQKVNNSEVGIFRADVDMIDIFRDWNVDPNYEAAPVGKPVLKEGDTPKDATQDVYSHGFTISTVCENVELAVQWMDYWYTEETRLLANYGIEDDTFTYDDAGVPHFTDKVLQDPDGLNFALFKYAVDWGPTVLDWSRKLDSYTQFQRDALDVWCNVDSSMSYPMYASYTTAEAEEIAQYQTDVQTVLDENLPKLATGAMSLDDYDSFVQMLNDCGLQKVLEIKQAAYDRYMSR